MSVAVLVIGTEITQGEVQDAHGYWLASRLIGLGFRVNEIAAVPDERDDIVKALDRLTRAHRVVICTGGLGPTSDDITSACVAMTAGVPLERFEAAYEMISRRLLSLGRTPTPSHERMAELPRGAEILGNPAGTAPAFVVPVHSASCFVLPGVPEEMHRIFDEMVTPRIGPLVVPTSYQIVLRCYGLPESVVGERLADLEKANPGLSLGYRLSFPEVEVKVRVRSQDLATARSVSERVAAEIRTRLGENVYGEQEDSLAAAVGRELRARGFSLALAESCTGGLIGSLLTAVPGSSDYLLLDAVTYANSAKERVLGVPSELLIAHGAVSAECAKVMAEGVRRLGGADVGLSVTGVAGPSGGSAQKPVGLVFFALATAQGTRVYEQHFVGDRQRIQLAAAFFALGRLREACRGTFEVMGPARCG